MEWIEFTLLCIRQRLNVVWLLSLIIISLLIYNFTDIPFEVFGIIISPLFTLSILSILEERKTKWNTKYETFKLLYANRGNIVDYNVVKHLNCIDIIFIDDNNVRQKWRELFDKYIKGQELDAQINNSNPNKRTILQNHYQKQKVKLNELLNAMAISLGLNKNITQSDINASYYPKGLSDFDELISDKAKAEIMYYIKGTNFFEENLSLPPSVIQDKDKEDNI